MSILSSGFVQVSQDQVGTSAQKLLEASPHQRTLYITNIHSSQELLIGPTSDLTNTADGTGNGFVIKGDGTFGPIHIAPQVELWIVADTSSTPYSALLIDGIGLLDTTP